MAGGDFTEDLFQKFEVIRDSVENKKAQIASFEEDSKLELLRFLRNQINTITGKNDLKTLVTNLLKSRLEGEGIEEITTGTLIRLLEVLNKTDTEMSGSILNVLKQQVNIQQTNYNSNNQNNLIPVMTQKEDLKNISKEDFLKYKRVYEFFQKAEHTELKDVTPPPSIEE